MVTICGVTAPTRPRAQRCRWRFLPTPCHHFSPLQMGKPRLERLERRPTSTWGLKPACSDSKGHHVLKHCLGLMSPRSHEIRSWKPRSLQLLQGSRYPQAAQPLKPAA